MSPMEITPQQMTSRQNLDDNLKLVCTNALDWNYKIFNQEKKEATYTCIF